MRHSKLKKDGLNIVPFIDVMLVLLCLVLSISTFIAQGKIKVDLPTSKSAVRLNEQESINLVIDANSTIYLNDEAISQEEFENRLNDINATTLIVLRSDKEAKFESFVRVIDALKVKGHENFAITTNVEK
ncbi:MAG: TonB system transport protein ExbD [Campylobacter sp.]|nr:TonB system transport protein ExbD [Campylobacter sp.]